MNRKPEYWKDEGDFQLTWIDEDDAGEIVVRTSPRQLDGQRSYRFVHISDDTVVAQDCVTTHVCRFLRVEQDYEVIRAPRFVPGQTTLDSFSVTA